MANGTLGLSYTGSGICPTWWFEHWYGTGERGLFGFVPLTRTIHGARMWLVNIFRKQRVLHDPARLSALYVA